VSLLSVNFILVTSSQVNLLDAIPDIGLFAGANRYLCGVIEVKKHVLKVIDNILNSESRGSGQAFEQLALCKMFLRGESYGMISTFNAARLLSTGNFKSDLAKVREKLANVNPSHASVQQRSSDTVSYTPDRLGPEIDFDEELDHDLTELLPQEEGQDPETAQDMRRELYGFERVELGCYGDFEETIVEKNRKMLQTIANFVLLAANAVKDTRKIGRILEGGSRVFDVENGTFHLRKVTFDRGIDFNSLPCIEDTKFYVWSQLGTGSSGTCCLGTVRREVKEGKSHFYGALCVVKIYHTRLINSEDETEFSSEKAELEAANWGTVYADEKWDFVRAHVVHPFVLLIMPYFCVPNNPKERGKLLGLPGTKKEESLLWKGLQRFAAKGKKHCDLKWHHVGVFRKKDSNGQVEKLVYLLDLESIEDLHPQDMESWVAKSYEELGSRANLEVKKQVGVVQLP
jgi:hypothetical protein